MPIIPKLTRDKLAAFIKDPESIRAVESLFNNLSTTPDDIAEAISKAEAAQIRADDAFDDATNAQATADIAVTNAASAQTAANLANTGLATHAALTSAHGTVGTVVGTTDSQVLSNKTINGATPLTGQTLMTGATTPALTASKPGASSAIVSWWNVNINGVSFVIPLYSPT